MLNPVINILDKQFKEGAKKAFLKINMEMVEIVLKTTREIFPHVNVENLTVNLVEEAQRIAAQMTELQVKFKEYIRQEGLKEINAQQKTTIAA